MSEMSVEGLSDAELRTKLAEYGYPVGPVTQTTRKILVKKLKNLIDSRGGTGSRHSLAARYSSDETDDDASSTLAKKKKSSASSRRQTLANPMPPPAPVPLPSDMIGTRKSPIKEKTLPGNSDFRGIRASPIKDKPLPLNSDFSESSQYDHSPTPYPNRTLSKTIQKKMVKTYKSSMSVSDGLETGSDSDIPDDTHKTHALPKYGKDANMRWKSYDTKSRQYNTVDHNQIARPYEPKPQSAHTAKDNKYINPPFKPNISPILSPKEDTSGRDASQEDILDKYETPFLSEFTRRLSAQTSLNLQSVTHPTVKNSGLRNTASVLPEVKENDSNGHFSSLKSLYSMSSPSTRHTASTLDRSRETATKSFKLSATSREEARNNQNIVSMILVIVAALFFGILAVLYMGLGEKSEPFPSLPSDINIQYCSSGTVDDTRPGVNCLFKNDVDIALELLKRLYPILKEKAISVMCDNSSETPYLTDTDIIKMFGSKNVHESVVKQDLRATQLLINNNPDWGISLIDVSSDNEGSIQVLKSMHEVFSARVNSNVGMVILNPELPMQCHIKNKLFSVFSTLLIVAIGLVAAFGTQKLVLWYLRYKKSTEREVFLLVSEIINMVEMHHQNAGASNATGAQESFLAINHVRDNIIPPKDRKKMAGLWEKAVKFLDENESRIRREVQQVAGEEFHVWRWLPNNTLNTSNTHSPVANKKSKVWQGQAFGTMEGSVNSLTCSPTPCLKIRHMFDPDVEIEDDWETKVQDAIVEKCGEGVKILHIRVDRGSREGCVYMKCMSQEDAGKAYRALHGCWFDGHLVTVKYLRLERYHERFPDAIRCTTPLKPSNNQRLSLQAHYWKTPLETN